MGSGSRIGKLFVVALGALALIGLLPGTATAAYGVTRTFDGSGPFTDGQQVPLVFTPNPSTPPPGGWQDGLARVEAYECPGLLLEPSLTDYCIPLGRLDVFQLGGTHYVRYVTLRSTIATPNAPITTDCKVVSACFINIIHYGPSGASVVGDLPALFYDPPVIAPGSATVTEGDSGTTALEVPVTLSHAPTVPVTVRWQTVFVPGWPPEQADPAADYTGTPAIQTLTFAPGETTKYVTISVNGDVVPEPDEFIVVQFGQPTNARMGGMWGLGFGFIGNDEDFA